MVVPLTRHVLVVDDAPVICRLLSYTLHPLGLICVCAYNLDQARALLSNYSFDFYILDLNLGGESGIALCKEIREKETTTPVVIFTASDRSINPKNVLEVGATALIDKTEPEDLISIVKDHFGIE